MIKLVSKGNFFDDKIEEAIKIYGELAIKSRKEEGCITYNLFQDINDKTVLTMIEEWENEEILEKHRNTEHFKTLVPIVKGFRKDSELNIYKLVL